MTHTPTRLDTHDLGLAVKQLFHPCSSEGGSYPNMEPQTIDGELIEFRCTACQEPVWVEATVLQTVMVPSEGVVFGVTVGPGEHRFTPAGAVIESVDRSNATCRSCGQLRTAHTPIAAGETLVGVASDGSSFLQKVTNWDCPGGGRVPDDYFRTEGEEE